MISGFAFYKIHTAISLHFNSKYDVIKYAGKVPKIDERYGKKSNQSLYERWGKACKDTSLAYELCIANGITHESEWVYSELNGAFATYKAWKETRNYQSIENDFKYLGSLISSKKAEFYDDLIQKTKSGKTPPLLQLYLGDGILPDTVVVLDAIHTKFFEKWMKDYENDPLISVKLSKLNKYKSFVKFNLDKLTPMLTDEILNKETW
jgi:hypothetical protein